MRAIRLLGGGWSRCHLRGLAGTRLSGSPERQIPRILYPYHRHRTLTTSAIFKKPISSRSSGVLKVPPTNNTIEDPEKPPIQQYTSFQSLFTHALSATTAKITPLGTNFLSSTPPLPATLNKRKLKKIYRVTLAWAEDNQNSLLGPDHPFRRFDTYVICSTLELLAQLACNDGFKEVVLEGFLERNEWGERRGIGGVMGSDVYELVGLFFRCGIVDDGSFEGLVDGREEGEKKRLMGDSGYGGEELGENVPGIVV